MTDIIDHIFFADLVCETSNSIGTKPFVLNGARDGYRRFGDVVPMGRPFYYAINNISDHGEWEVGIGYIDDDDLLQRSPIISSKDNQMVDFGIGIKNVNLTVSADWFAEQHDKARAAHDHNIADVIGLAPILDNKQNKGDYAQTNHQHIIDDIADLSQLLSSKQAIGDYASLDHSHNLQNLKLGGQTQRNFFNPSDQLIVADIVADPSGASAVNVAASNIFARRNGLDGAQMNGLDGGSNARVLFGSSLKFNSFGAEFRLTGAFSESTAGSSYVMHTNNGGTALVNTRPQASLGKIDFRTMKQGETAPVARWEVQNVGHLAPSADNIYSLGTASLRVNTIFAASGAINTSDENAKKDIGAIPDEWLDAWGDVEWSRYKFKDGNRWHIGLVAQRVHAAFAVYDVDAFEIGLLCRDNIDAQYKPVFSDDGKVVEGEREALISEAIEIWGLRYDQCFAMEAAFQRRELNRQVASLSEKIANLSGHS